MYFKNLTELFKAGKAFRNLSSVPKVCKVVHNKNGGLDFLIFYKTTTMDTIILLSTSNVQ
jgi:hypothetical protein